MGCVSSRKGKNVYPLTCWEKLWYWWHDDTVTSPFLVSESQLDVYRCLDCRDTGFVLCEHCIGHGIFAEISEDDAAAPGHYLFVPCSHCGGRGKLRCYCGQCHTPAEMG